MLIFKVQYAFTLFYFKLHFRTLNLSIRNQGSPKIIRSSSNGLCILCLEFINQYSQYTNSIALCTIGAELSHIEKFSQQLLYGQTTTKLMEIFYRIPIPGSIYTNNLHNSDIQYM